MGSVRRLLEFALRHIGVSEWRDITSWGLSVIASAGITGFLWWDLPTELRIIVLFGAILVIAPIVGWGVACILGVPSIVLPDALNLGTELHRRGPMPGFHLTLPLLRIRNRGPKAASIELVLRIYNERIGKKQDLVADQTVEGALSRTIDIPGETTIPNTRVVFWLTVLHVAAIRFAPYRGGMEGFKIRLLVRDLNTGRVIKARPINSVMLLPATGTPQASN